MRCYLHHLLLLLLLSFSIVPAAGQKLDSLLKALHSYKKDDAKKLSLLNQVAQEYRYTNIALGLQVADTAIVLGKKINDSTGLASAYLSKGQVLYANGNNNKALEQYQIALELSEALSIKVKIAACLTNIGAVYFSLKDYNKALSYYNKSITLSEQLADKKSMASAYNNAGAAYSRLWSLSKALEMYQRAAVLFKEGGDLRGYSGALQNVGTAYIKMTDYPKAITYFQQSLLINEKLGPASTGTMTNLNNLGVIYYNSGNYQKALEYYEKELAMQRVLSKKDSSSVLYRIGNTYLQLKQPQKAETYYYQSINTSHQVGNKEDFYVLNALGLLYTGLADFLKAWPIFNRGLAATQKDQNKEGMGLLTLSLGNWCRDAPDSALAAVGINPSTRYTTTLAYLNDGRKYSEEVGEVIQVRSAWESLSIAHERNHEYNKALEAYKKYITLRDSITNNQNEKKVQRLVMQYEFDKKSDSMKLQEQITAQQLEKQVLLATQQQQEILLGKSKLELSNKELELSSKKLELSNKEKDLQHLAFLSTQSSFENERLEKQGKIKQLSLSENEKQLQAARVKSLTQEKRFNELKRQQQLNYLLIGLGVISFIILYFFYKARLQRVRLRNQVATEKLLQEQKEIEFEKQLADVSMSALRSQMNPHFIFNCLNSIKLYTEQNNTSAASEYLTKFSKLIRQVLDNSRTDRIVLTAELNALSLYMDMEAMRFKDKLKYSITVDKNVDADYIEIPPMLLQPYVENAIWHGLMPKERGGKIEVAVALNESESMVVVNIADDGIGRAKSALIKSKTATKHKSFGMKVTSERLALTNVRYKTDAGVMVTDMFDNHGLSTGTRVTLTIPIE